MTREERLSQIHYELCGEIERHLNASTPDQLRERPGIGDAKEFWLSFGGMRIVREPEILEELAE